MKAGQLRHKMVIERATTSRASTGHAQQTWATHLLRFAAIRPLSSKELLAYNIQIQTEATHEITLRGPLDITTKDRIKFGERIFNIIGVINVDERNKEIKVTAKEKN